MFVPGSIAGMLCRSRAAGLRVRRANQAKLGGGGPDRWTREISVDPLNPLDDRGQERLGVERGVDKELARKWNSRIDQVKRDTLSTV